MGVLAGAPVGANSMAPCVPPEDQVPQGHRSQKKCDKSSPEGRMRSGVCPGGAMPDHTHESGPDEALRNPNSHDRVATSESVLRQASAPEEQNGARIRPMTTPTIDILQRSV